MYFMSILSEKLNEYLVIKKQTPYQLAQNCPFENATLYQYLNGKRPLKKKEHLDIIISLLKLTPEEMNQLMEAYEIELIGIDLYRQRQKVEELLFSLQSIHSSFEVLNHENLCETIFHIQNIEESKVFYGELDVKRVAFAMIYNAFQSGSTIHIFLPLEQKALLHGLTLLGNLSCSAPAPQITHIICFDSDNTKGSIANLERLRQVLGYGIAVKSYCPMYFYGNCAEHFSSTNLLPGLILTETAALQVSFNGKYALFHENSSIILLFRNFFEQLCGKCHPLMADNINLMNRMECAINNLEKSDFKKVLEISSGICSVPFWNRQILETYLNPELPQYEYILEYYMTYASKLYEIKRKKLTILLMKSSFVLDFIKTGIFKEYPPYFFAKPLSLADRKYILRCILSACHEGWYQIQFVKDTRFPLDYGWELGVVKGSHVLFQYFEQDKSYAFNFKEPGIVNALYDYLENLSNGQYAMTPKESKELLTQWIQQYL